ncbi:hypothetical protein [Streptomyces glaucosporus]|uniref:hypothetical protein n=1 Tax=Streptomyces glaucosporus TaxID=284044 RepID=UPI0031E27B8E
MDASEATTFPPRPIRGVRAKYVRQAGCPCDFADVTVDFEPWEEGFAFEVAGNATVDGTCLPGELVSFHAALAEGIREELTRLPDGTTVAVAVVLRNIRIHEIDSHEGSFREAGRVAVREALVRLHGPPPRPKRRRT